MEHCTTRFFENCDLDNDKYIALEEWAGCFGIKESECAAGLWVSLSLCLSLCCPSLPVSDSCLLSLSGGLPLSSVFLILRWPSVHLFIFHCAKHYFGNWQVHREETGSITCPSGQARGREAKAPRSPVTTVLGDLWLVASPCPWGPVGRPLLLGKCLFTDAAPVSNSAIFSCFAEDIDKDLVI